ncbi:MAG TPA: hypothetical protein VMR74_10545, partial [Gammaproteobacteria bacterium]|nr:hypothetical protein [Gammaproteobacteria bacterium]
MQSIGRKFAVILMALLPIGAGLACSLAAPLPPAEELVDSATVIVRARAMGLSDNLSPAGGPASSNILVEFQVLRVLKGELSSRVISFDGHIVSRNDFNELPVPYPFIRPGGRSGNCYALEYRLGSQYLLILRTPHNAEDAKTLTPYWSPLAPTNEQIRGSQDPWLV